jgi:hypothetical protein
VFRGTTGHAEMVTDDKSGKKLPSHSFGKWVFSRTINVVTKTRLTGGGECGQVLTNVTKDGYHHWPSGRTGLPVAVPSSAPVTIRSRLNPWTRACARAN